MRSPRPHIVWDPLLYSSSSYLGFRAGLNGHINERLDIHVSICCRTQNSYQLMFWKGFLKEIRRAGKDKTTHQPPISPKDQCILKYSAALNPKGLLNKVWFSIQLHFGRRGKEETDWYTPMPLRVNQLLTRSYPGCARGRDTRVLHQPQPESHCHIYAVWFGTRGNKWDVGGIVNKPRLQVLIPRWTFGLSWLWRKWQSGHVCSSLTYLQTHKTLCGVVHHVENKLVVSLKHVIRSRQK